MDIAIVGNQSIKIKGKQVTFVVDPAKETPKMPADAIILLNGSGNIDVSRVTESRIVIDGPGGYEVGGAKISGTKTSKGILYRLSIEGISVVLGSAMEVKMEGFDVCDVAVINTNNDFNEAFVTALEPKMTVLYGDKKTEAAKTLGAESVSPVSKITVAKDKLPEKMEIVVLG
ncbi:MAG: Zn-dependent hydrolase [Candidatus Levybacteria bacterium]|nr:Zn-dependent hydrolase [Candidatus Levybacteria bacterium]